MRALILFLFISNLCVAQGGRFIFRYYIVENYSPSMMKYTNPQNKAGAILFDYDKGEVYVMDSISRTAQLYYITRINSAMDMDVLESKTDKNYKIISDTIQRYYRTEIIYENKIKTSYSRKME